jgi:renalase
MESSSSPTDVPPVAVVGAGIAGAACAVALRAAGIGVRLVDRGRAVGGRMASPLLHGRRVDIGAGYFTVRDPGFQAVVDDWEMAGLARRWTNTFGILTAGQAPGTTSGPDRWSTPGGLRSLVRALLDGVEVDSGSEIDSAGLAALPGIVVLAMPDPQASRLTAVPDAVDYDPVVTVVAGFSGRRWPFADAAFVHDHPAVEFIADDGARRGDGAPVLVAHSTADLARASLRDPPRAVAPVIDGLRNLLGLDAPEWTHAHRWSFAKPAAAHQATHGFAEVDGRTVWFAGDQWCPQGSPRVESAWRSGTEVAAAIVARG